MRRIAASPAAWRAGGLGLCLALVLAAAPAAPRPLQVEDLLQREELGAVEIAPGGRWLVVEQRGPFAAAARFDFGDLNRLFRTRILAADLAAGGPLRPLFPAEPGTGYRLGPISPDGTRAAVYRLTAERWELGIASLAGGGVTWTGLTPEAPGVPRTLQWASSSRLLAIVLPPGTLPYEIRAYRRQAASPPRWAATARGEASVMVVGSGVHRARHGGPLKRLVAVSADTGAAEPLAVGDFVDLELSASGRHAALLEAAEPIPLRAGRPVHGAYGLAMRRTRLRLLDLRTGVLSAPCGGCDVLGSLLSWSPARDSLLAFARSDDAPWTEGRLLRIDADTGHVAPVDAGLQAALVLRVERVAAGWLGADPILFGRPPGGLRDDWFRLSRGGPIRLTAALAHPTREIVVSGRTILAAVDGGAWRIDPGGRARRLTSGVFLGTARRSEGLTERTLDGAVRATSLSGVERKGGLALTRRFGAGGIAFDARPLPVAPQDEVLAVSLRGALLERTSGGGAQRLVWRRPGAEDLTLATFNRHLADVDRPAPIAIAHPGPDGQPLVSWLFLPPPCVGPPPPLVVVPYPERTFPRPPTGIWTDAAIAPAAALVGRGYAVLLPSLPSARLNTGPADRLSARILAIVEAARRQPDVARRFDGERLALWGHSFGGYAVATVIGQTSRFRAAVAIAPATDLISRHGEFGPARRLTADEAVPTYWSAGWVETLQGDMRVPPWEDPQRYLRNSPIMGAGGIETPLLIAYGEADGSHPGQAEELFSALFRQDKDAVLLAYWGESHLLDSPGNLRDLYRRAFAFLDRHLGPVDGTPELTASIAAHRSVTRRPSNDASPPP